MVDGDNPPPPPPPTGPPRRRTLKDLTSQSLTSLKPTGTDKGRALLTSFPFSLTDSAEEWFYNLPQGSITSWNDMQKVFLEKYFPASKAASIRKAITGIEQIVGETLYDYWEQYKKLLSSCPHHQISEQLIVQYFYDGMLQSERNLIDAASGGALTNKTIDEATELIKNMDANTQQFNTRGTSMARRVNDVSSSSHLEERIGNMEKMMQQMEAVIIPTYEEEAEQKDHPNFSYANKQAAVSNPIFGRQGGFQQSQFQPQHQQHNQSSSLEEMMKAMMQKQNTILQQNTQYQKKNDATVKDLQLQMGQITTDVNSLKAQASTKLPSQPFVNPREHINAVTLRSGRQVEEPRQQGSNLDTGAVRVPNDDIEKEVEAENAPLLRQNSPRIYTENDKLRRGVWNCYWWYNLTLNYASGSLAFPHRNLTS
ncbi:uncharacterized protein LOC113352829 [Papaver somniferum]|uniref:uncharacterized protein LOC113352829 n=1 Tax=Papaver somniferum TaxID=3469 RepID=UPI000E7000CF|nr:uncharacterized protein LOC113352829 [Papaver somniferum]